MSTKKLASNDHSKGAPMPQYTPEPTHQSEQEHNPEQEPEQEHNPEQEQEQELEKKVVHARSKPKHKIPPSELDQLKNISGTPEELTVICKVFNQNILAILRFLQSKEPDSPDIHALNTIIKECVAESKTLMLDRCKDKIWGAREFLQHEDEDYFIKRDYGNLIKRDHNENMITSLVNIIKDGWQTLYDEEKGGIWIKTKLMLKCVAVYEKWRRATEQ